MIDCAYQFSICWIVCSWFFWLFHQSSVPYNAIDSTTASWICQTNPGISLWVFVKPLIWILAVYALLILSLIYDINFNWLSSQTPSHLVAFLLKILFSLPTLILVSRCYLLSRWQCDLENSTVFVLEVSYVTALVLPHSKTVVTTVHKVWTISVTDVPKAINPRSSANDKDVTVRLFSIIVSNTPLIYIRKKMGETDDPWEMPVSISLSLLSYLLMTNWISRSVKKDLVYATRSLSISRLIICVGSCSFKTWSNAPLTFINKAPASISYNHVSCTLCINIAIESIADCSFCVLIWTGWNLVYASQNWESCSAMTFLNILQIQFRKLITRYDLTRSKSFFPSFSNNIPQAFFYEFGW